VTLPSAVPEEAFRNAATELWKRVRDELDPARQLNFGGIQEQAVRGRRIAGQVFIRRLWRRLNAPLAVPFQLQVLEAEHCPEHYDTHLPNGNTFRAGKEYDSLGLLVTYWFYPDHPHDYRLGVSTDVGRLVRVPAVDVIQHYSPPRPGQDHGEPSLVRSLLAADTLDKCLDAELRRKETRAPYTGAIERDWSDEDLGTNPATGDPLDADGAASVEPDTMLELNMCEKVHLFDADAGVQGIWGYARGVLLQVAAGAGGVPYELVTGD
jgi:capsid protein